MVIIGFNELCPCPCVAKGWSLKEMNPLVSETTEFACIIIVNIDIIMAIKNTRCVEKVSRLKLYLPKQNWTMNEKFQMKFKELLNKIIKIKIKIEIEW